MVYTCGRFSVFSTVEEDAGLKPGSKYYPLHMYLRRVTESQLSLRLEAIECILGASLPRSAWETRAFWSNRTKGGVQAGAWLEAGFHVQSVDLAHACVVFARPRIHYRVRQEMHDSHWDAEMVRSLRRHMAMSQQDFARELGVRQQTISEWERGIYAPSRSRSKHLNLVAEDVGMVFEVINPENEDETNT